MTKLQILGVAALGLSVLAHEAAAQRGGAVRSGMRGAVVGGMVGGDAGAATGAKVGAVTGATRTAIDREAQARTQYQTTATYQSAPRSNFNETPPDVIGGTAADAGVPPSTTTKPGEEVVIRKDGTPMLGITFPADWKQKTGDRFVMAVSGDGQAYSALATLEGVPDKASGIKKVKEGLEKYFQDIKYDEASETNGGTMVITGTGKTKKSGVEVAFAVGVFEAQKGQLAGAAFVVDEKMEDHYKETVRGICETLRRADDFAKK
jgi:hypothetical protein